MPGKKGHITRAVGGKQKAIYLSDKFGVWPEGKGFHFTAINTDQEFHTSVTQKDGLLYEALKMLYSYGKVDIQ
jgi:hypothetical protein